MILKINDYEFFFLNPINDLNDENENSLVIYTKLLNNKVLFMGDSGILAENNILNKCNIDILKVEHHGFDTSTSKAFIDEIKPKYSLISVSKNNIYGHPKEEIINRLENINSKIFMTSIDGSIKINFYKKSVTFKKYEP